MVSQIRTANREELLKQVEALYPDALDEINHALDFAEVAHGAQQRASGLPFVVHPIEVASILADLHMDSATVSPVCCTTP
jgi:GTP pyrophosphokinase